MYLYNQLQALKICSIYKTLIKSAIKSSICIRKTVAQFIKKQSLQLPKGISIRRLASKRKFVWSERKSGDA
jgi:hypothetical protein